MTIDQLRALCAVTETGSFRAAADKLYKSQSAISIAIGKLESELAITLFERNSYRPTLTAEGQLLYNKARSILARTRDFTQLAEHLSKGEEPSIRLAISGILPIEPIIGTLKKVSAIAPATSITLQVENLHGAMERLHDREADIVLTDAFEPENNYEYVELTQIEFVTVLASSITTKLPVDIVDHDLEDIPQIVVRDSSRHTARLSKGLLDGTNRWTVNDFATKKSIIMSGSGWGGMPLHMVRDELAAHSLVRLSPGMHSGTKVTVYLVRERHKPLGPIGSQLWQMLKDISWP